MGSERGQATVEWVGLVLLLALGLGALAAFAPRVHGRSVGVLVADRITCSVKARCDGDERTPAAAHREAGALAPVAPPLVPTRGGLRELIKRGARKGVAANALACYLRKSTASNDTNSVGDDIGDAINCLNPVGGWTGAVGGTDD